METNVSKKKYLFTPQEAIVIIENAFNQADAYSKFENNYVFAVKPEKGQQIIIKPKDPFCYDPITIEKELSNKFDSDQYSFTITCFMIIINKKSVM